MDIEKIKQLREQTGAGVMDAKQALEQTNGSLEQAISVLQKKGFLKAQKRQDRETQNGIVYAYIHNSEEVGALLELNCETSFVAKTQEFKRLAHELALQIVSMNPETIEDLLRQDSIRDPKSKIEEMAKNLTAQTGENIVIRRFARFKIGEDLHA